MSDLIDRQAAIEDIRTMIPKDAQFDIKWIEMWLKQLPSAEPVRHGKNVGTDYDETDQFVCSECGIELQGWYRVEHDEDDDDETIHEYRFRYCPHCGARMDKE